MKEKKKDAIKNLYEAITACAKKAEATSTAGEAMHFTQAAVNAVNALAVLSNITEP